MAIIASCVELQTTMPIRTAPQIDGVLAYPAVVAMSTVSYEYWPTSQLVEVPVAGWEALRWVEWHFAWRGTYN